MIFNALTPMLWTDDLPKTIAFYETVLGFVVDAYNPDWGWCHMHRDKVAMMFTRPNEHFSVEKVSFTGSFYIYTEEVDVLWDRLKDSASISYTIANFPHRMREFAILDNNGYMLQFGRELRDGEEVTECA